MERIRKRFDELEGEAQRLLASSVNPKDSRQWEISALSLLVQVISAESPVCTEFNRAQRIIASSAHSKMNAMHAVFLSAKTSSKTAISSKFAT